MNKKKFFFFSLIIVSADAPKFWQMGFQDPATPIMEGIIDLHHDLMFFLLLVCVVVFWMLLRSVILFREKDTYVNFEDELVYRLPSRMTHHTALEMIWTIVPSIILLSIAIPSFSLLYAMDEIINPRLTIKIIGHQWYWSYECGDRAYRKIGRFQFDSYMILPEDLKENQFRLLDTDKSLVLPTHVNIRLLITSADVLHSWAVPSLGIKVDACPGRLNQVALYLKRDGIFYGQCSEICGVNHGFMPIKVLAVSTSDYLDWYIMSIAHTRKKFKTYYRIFEECSKLITPEFLKGI